MDDLVKQLTAMRADYVGTRAGWIIRAAIDRITELEAWKAAEDAHHGHLKRRIADLEAENAELREVLKPFARIAEQGVHLSAGASTPVNIDRCRDAAKP